MYVSDVAEQNPTAVAVIMAASGDSRSYAELDEASNRYAHLFRALGLATGDHLSLLIDNRLEFFDITVAAHRAGLHYTAISTHLTPDEISFIVSDSDAKALVVSAALAQKAAAISAPAGTVLLAVGGDVAGYQDADVLAADMPSSKIDDESAGSPMLYSSGTTGRPKGVKFPASGQHPRVVDPFTESFIAEFGIDGDSVLLLPGPLYHTSPLFYANMVLRLGGRLIVLERFDAEEALGVIEKHGVTHSFFVPTMLIRMLRLPDAVRSRYRLGSHVWSLTGAAPCPHEVKERILQWWGPILWEGYAGSERNGMTILRPEEVLSHPGSVGRPIGCGVEVVDENGAEVPVGEDGLIYFTGGHAFEYYKDPDKTARAYLRPHVSTLGDIGHVDSEGFLYLTDRLANVIIAGGVNIYPQEIEGVLALHPAVEDVAVVGRPDPDLGETPHAVVVARWPVDSPDELSAELVNYCQQRVARFKVPRSVQFVDRLPRLPNGKLAKHRLKLPQLPATSEGDA